MVIMRLIDADEYKDYIAACNVIEIVKRGSVEYELCENK